MLKAGKPTQGPLLGMLSHLTHTTALPSALGLLSRLTYLAVLPWLQVQLYVDVMDLLPVASCDAQAEIARLEKLALQFNRYGDGPPCRNG